MSDENKRQSKRVGLQRAVLFGPEKPPKHWAYITNISDKGIFIKTSIVYPESTVIYITIKDEGGVDHEMVGEVMRTKKIPPAFYREGVSGMGVHLLVFEEEFLDLYRQKMENEKESVD